MIRTGTGWEYDKDRGGSKVKGPLIALKQSEGKAGSCCGKSHIINTFLPYPSQFCKQLAPEWTLKQAAHVVYATVVSMSMMKGS